MKRLFFIVFVLFLSSSAYALEIENPRTVDRMTAEVIQTVNITMERSPAVLEMRMYIPQEDEYQKILSFFMDYNYTFVKDRFGNKLLYAKWRNPGREVSFSVISLVEVKKRSFDGNYKYEEFIKPNSLVNSDDKEIREIAESLILGKNEFDRIASMTSWVNERIRYDMKYFSVNLSSRDVLKTGAGVCDEYSTLLSALARSVGYYSPYIVGYAYGKDKFQAHGWTSINGVVSDPTWGEMPVDATHIKFAVLKDAVYTETNVTVKGIGKVYKPSIDVKVKIKPVSVHETKTVKTKSEFLPSPGNYAVLKTDLSSDGCILTKFVVKSCVYGDKPFLEGNYEKNIYFCNNKTVFSVFKVPDMGNVGITCPVTVFSYDGTSEIVSFSITGGGRNSNSIKADVGNTVFEAGEKYSVHSPGSYIFTDDGQYGFENAKFEARENTTLYIYNKGNIETRKITVLKKKPISVYVIMNNTVVAGTRTKINLVIENRLNKLQNITVAFEGNMQNILVPPLSNRTVSLHFLPEANNDSMIQVSLYSDGFSTTVTKTLNVLDKEKSVFDIIDGFIEGLQQLINRISENISILINFS